MSQIPTLPLSAVRALLLSAQGLLQPPSRPAQKEDVLETIRRIGALQIDTIHVVARAPYFILFSRLGEYDPAWLDEHLAERRLFEYWAHAACFIPIEDYPLYHHRMHKETQRYYSPEWGERQSQTIEAVMERIRAGGEVRSADFERTDGKRGTWWDWKIEKQVLEYLHTTGELMIARREKFQRVYDLRERILPGFDESGALPMDAAQDELAARSVRYLGAVLPAGSQIIIACPSRACPPAWSAWSTRDASCASLSRAGRNLPTSTLRTSPSSNRPPTASQRLQSPPCSPPSIPWLRTRARALELFNFDYSIECYLPQPKRRYGYFSLPILHQGALVGRIDAKAHRKGGIVMPGG